MKDQNLKNTLYILGSILILALIIFVSGLARNELIKTNYVGLENAKTISVEGEKVIHETPNEAEIMLSVVSQSSDYSSSVEENNAKMSQIIDYLKKQDIPEEDLQTQGFQVTPRYEENETLRHREEGEIVGYQAENTLKVTVTNLDELGNIIQGSVSAGANKVKNLSFVVSNKKEIKREARTEAITNAKKEAQSIADSLGVKLGQVMNYSESGGFHPVRMEADVMEEMQAGGASVPVEPGKNEIRSSVNVTFEIK